MAIDYIELREAVRQASEHAKRIGDHKTEADLSAVLRLLSSRMPADATPKPMPAARQGFPG